MFPLVHDGKSKRFAVMAKIRFETSAATKSRQTSIWSLITRKLVEPTSGEKANDNRISNESSWCSLRRDGLAFCRLATCQPKRASATSAYREGDTSKKMEQGESLATSFKVVKPRLARGVK